MSIAPRLRATAVFDEPIRGALGVAASDPAIPRRVYQHAVGQTYKDVALTGQYMPISGNLQYRMKRLLDDSVAIDWTNCTPGSANTFSITPRVELAHQFVYLELRDSANPNAILSTMLTRIGTGLKIALGGQSNRQRRTAKQWGAASANDLVMRHSGGTVRGHYRQSLLLRGDESASNNGSDGMGGDADTAFANTVQAALGHIVEIMPFAVSGSSIEQWLTAGNGGTAVCWNQVLNAVALANNDAEFRYWFRFQGEANAAAANTEADYQAKLALEEAQIYALCGSRSDFRYFVAPIASSSASDARTGIIQTATQKFINANASGRVRRAGSLLDCTRDTDNLHYPWGVTDGYLRACLRDAQCVLYDLGQAAFDGGGPIITGVSGVAGNNYVDVTVALNGGTRLENKAGSPSGTGLPNFFFTKGGVDQGSGPAAITGANTLRVALPSGVLGAAESWTLQHVRGKTVTTDFVYENVNTPGDTIGRPLEASAPIAVTGL